MVRTDMTADCNENITFMSCSVCGHGFSVPATELHPATNPDDGTILGFCAYCPRCHLLCPVPQYGKPQKF